MTDVAAAIAREAAVRRRNLEARLKAERSRRKALDWKRNYYAKRKAAKRQIEEATA